LAEIGLESRFMLGKYGIDMVALDAIALSAIENAINLGYLVVIDEIGFMELKSRRFRGLVLKALALPPPVIATIMRSSFDFPDTIKDRGDVTIITVRIENRDLVIDEIVEKVRDLI
jgi:nucleoside-triphosphatase